MENGSVCEGDVIRKLVDPTEMKRVMRRAKYSKTSNIQQIIVKFYRMKVV